MKSLRLLARSILALACAVAATTAGAAQSGITPQGHPYVSGGVSQEELAALHERRQGFNLWVVTAALRSGAHLADVRVSIRDAGQKLLFDAPLDGPWLFISLPLGRYEVQAAFEGKVQRRFTTIHRGDLHQVFFYFDSGDTVSPDQAPPFERSPYGDGSKPR